MKEKADSIYKEETPSVKIYQKNFEKQLKSANKFDIMKKIP